MPSPHRRTTAALIALGPVVGAISLDLPLPGLDRALASAVGAPGAITLGVVQLLIVLCVVASARPDMRRLVAGGLLLGTALSGWALAARLEALSWGGEPLVVAPGIRFRLLAVLTQCGVAAALFAAAGQAERRLPVAPAWLLGWSYLVPWWIQAQAAHGAGLAAGRLWPGILEPAVAVGALLWLGLRPRAWPVQVVGQLRLRSGVEGVLAAWTVGFLTWSALGTVAGAAATVATVAVLDRRTAAAGRWSAPPLAGAVAVALVASAAWGAGFGRHGGLDRPYAGDGSVRAVLQSDAPVAAVDGPRLVERLAELQVDADVTVTSPNALTVQLRNVSEPGAVLQAALRAGRLEVLAEVARPAGPLPEGVTAEADGRRYYGSRDRLRAVAAPPDSRILLECDAAGDTGCVGHVVDPRPILVTDHVARVGVGYAAEGPYVVVDLDDAGRARFAAATAALVGRALVIAVDGEVLVAPLVVEPIPGGTFHITLSRQLDPEVFAQVLAAALAHPLDGDWSLASEG
ncbi:MAG: hypothetical protein R3F59_18385 [Myxococcota bacterium]